MSTCCADIPLGEDGAAHIYVDAGEGDDANTGLSPTNAFATFGAVVRRMNAWLAMCVKAPLVIHPAPGEYAEDVQFIIQSIPLDRVVVWADPADMTEITSGTLTAATAQLLTDSGASFGTSDELMGLIVEVFDPEHPDTTRQYKTIRNHVNTVIAAVGPVDPAPSAGWSYRVLTPSVNIVCQGTGLFCQNAGLLVVCPWTTAYDGNEEYAGGGPFVGFGFIRVTGAEGGSFAIRQKGGYVKWTGVVVDGASPGFAAFGGVAAAYGGFPGGDDLIYGTTETYSPNVDASLSVRTSNATGIRVDHAHLFGSPVAKGSDLSMFGGRGTFFGGAVRGAHVDVAEQSELQVFGGGVNALDAALPFTMLFAPAEAFLIREGSRAEVKDTSVQNCTGDGFIVDSDAFLRLLPTIAATGGDIGGVGVHVRNAGKAEVGSGVSFSSTGANLKAGTATSTFGALTVTTPVVDDAGASGQPGSLSVIWEV